MDCYFSGHCQPRRQEPDHQCFPICAERPRQLLCREACYVPCSPCPPTCPPANDHLRPAAGIASGQGGETEAYCPPDPCGRSHLRPSPRRSCATRVFMDCIGAPVPCTGDSLRFSRHANEDRGGLERRRSREATRPVQVGSQPMQFLRCEEYDPCPKKRGPDCDCFNPDGSWKPGKAPKGLELFPRNTMPIQVAVCKEADSDPCPQKKGPDCDCFNPDGTWKVKYAKASSPKIDPCQPTTRKCEDNCPECPIEIHSRTVYPKCEAMLPGYGGHVPGVNVCKFGKTFGRETREALQKVYSTPMLPRFRKSC